jgi:hypothetical protein
MDGGRGFTPQEVGEMTLDQVMMLLTDKNLLKGDRSRVTTTSAAKLLASNDAGVIHGKDSKGKPITGVIRGKSVARQLMEAKAAREATERAKVDSPTHKRRKRRG